MHNYMWKGRIVEIDDVGEIRDNCTLNQSIGVQKVRGVYVRDVFIHSFMRLFFKYF